MRTKEDKGQEYDLFTKCVIENHIQWLEIDHRFDTELLTSKSKKNKNQKNPIQFVVAVRLTHFSLRVL